MPFCITDVNPELTSKGNIAPQQYSLILPKSQHPPLSTIKGSQQGKGIQKYPPIKLEAIALQSRIIKATDTGDGRYTAEIQLQVPIRFTRSEIERLIEATDEWPGWGDDPRRCLAELGGLIEAAIAAVGGAQ